VGPDEPGASRDQHLHDEDTPLANSP
jgi:hypothetical protein